MEMLFDGVKTVFDFFFVDHFPPFQLIFWLFPLSFLYVAIILQLAVYCRNTWLWKVGYTRKFFHFCMFAAAGFYQWQWGIPGVFILGWAITAALMYLLSKGSSSNWWKVLARPVDAPRESYYIVYPYLATFAGGVLVNLFFSPEAAIAGYLVAGMGDAMGEPVGTKWGAHRYKVPSYGSSIVSYRSLEGSFAVFLASCLAFCISAELTSIPISLVFIIFSAFVAAVVEGISPHGWDNFTAQLASAILFTYLIAI